MTESTRPQRVPDSTADALRRGDRHAFEELFVQLRGDVYNLAARILDDRGEAEDVAQEVFLRAYRHLPGKKDQLRPEAWVFRTTVNACYDHLRRRRPAPVDLADDRGPAAHDTFEQAATAAAVEEALGRLNPRYRTALVLKDLQGLGNAEIAEIMGVSRGTVGVLLFRARAAFEKRYRQVAPTLGAGLPVAGLAMWLPTLPVPASLLAPPAFLAPLAGPLATATDVAPAALAPLTAGLAKLAGALTTKAAVVAIAAAVAAGGSIAVHEARDAGHSPEARTTTAATLPHHETESAADAPQHTRTHAALAAGEFGHDGAGDGHEGTLSGSGDGTHTGDGPHAGDGGQTAGTSSGDGAHTGDGTQSGGGQTGDGTHSGNGTSSGDGNHTGDGTETHGTQTGFGDAQSGTGALGGDEPLH